MVYREQVKQLYESIAVLIISTLVMVNQDLVLILLFCCFVDWAEGAVYNSVNDLCLAYSSGTKHCYPNLLLLELSCLYQVLLFL